VLFEQPFEDDRYWRIIEDSCSLLELQLLADGDLTEVRCILGSNVLIFPRLIFCCTLDVRVDLFTRNETSS
jgi:hypothetical protein